MNSPGRNARVSLRAAATAKEEASPPFPSTRGSARSASSRAEQVAPNPGAQTRAPVSASHAPRPGPPHAGEPRARRGGAGAWSGVSQRRAPRRGRCTRRRTTSRVGPEAPSARRGPLRPAGARPASSHRRRRLPSPSREELGEALGAGRSFASPASNAAARRRLSSAAAASASAVPNPGWPARTPPRDCGSTEATKTETPTRARGVSSGSPPRSASSAGEDGEEDGFAQTTLPRASKSPPEERETNASASYASAHPLAAPAAERQNTGSASRRRNTRGRAASCAGLVSVTFRDRARAGTSTR